MEFAVDVDKVRRQIGRIQGMVAAIEETLDPGGRAEVLTSQRKHMGHEKQQPPHGKAIAGFLRWRGHDPFQLPPAESARIGQFVTSEINDAMDRVKRSGRPEKDAVRRALIAGAMEAKDLVVAQIAEGRLGTKKLGGGRRRAWQMSRLRALAAAGRLDATWGIPPPYGVWTGRFVRGIRWRWRRGRWSRIRR